MPSGQATNTNFIVFGLTQSGQQLTVYGNRGEHATHYTTDAVYPLHNYNPLFVGRLMSYLRLKYLCLFAHYLRYLCLFTHSGVQHILCCGFVLFFFVLCPHVASFSGLSIFDSHIDIL